MSAYRKLIRSTALLVACLLSVASCASIPETGDPRVVRSVGDGNAGTPVAPPPNGLGSFELVRNFVNSAAAPEKDHETARLHLSREANERWHVPRELLILEDVDTVPAPQPPGMSPDVQMVSLQANKAGRLKADMSFVPEAGEYETQVRVERQRDGQWRIATPLPELLASRASFDANYVPVPIYFLDHDWSGVAPDVRYVVSKPDSTLPRRIIDLLTTGPSRALGSALDTAIPKGVHSKTNTSEDADGALVVNLSDLPDLSPEDRRRIAAQVVLSLQSVSNARVRLLEEGVPLLPGKEEVRPSDVAGYGQDNTPRRELPGLAVVDERLRILDEQAKPVAGAAGSHAYEVLRAGQSADGERLAAVTRKPSGGVGLRVGEYGGSLSELPVDGADMSKPTWRSGSEVWTVVDKREVARAFDEGDSWATQRVDTQAFSGGQPITDLRVSHDGTRVAGVVENRIVIAGVTERNGQVVLGPPTVLTGGPREAGVTGVEWLSNQSLVAITDSNVDPVMEVSIDGYKWDSYASENLGQPLTSVTVGPDRKVVVADRSGIWEAHDRNDVWGLLPVPIGGGSIPFFPG